MYINTVNEQIKMDNHQPTIGVLLCKTPNKTVIEYSIKNINAPMGVSNYKIKKALPKELKLGMPTMKELEHELEKEIEVTQNPLEQKLQKLKSIIRSNTKEEAKKARDKKVVRQIVDQLFLPLVNKVTSKTETEIKPLYHEAKLTYWIDGSGQPERDVFLKELEKSGTPEHVRVEYRFNGFKSAGLKAFNNRLEFQIEFEDFKYTVHCGHYNKGFTPVEKLYHHKITTKEIDDIANKLVEVLLDEVNEYAERNMKD